MSRGNSKRGELLRALEDELRNVSAVSVLFSQAVAGRLGMNATDLECLDILSRTGAVTAGRLAELTGLTTGAITGLVDRLERAGFVRREPDPTDRRRVIIQPLPLPEEEARRIEPIYGPLVRAMEGLYERYSEKDLALILDFITSANELVRQETVRLQTIPAQEDQSGDFRAPLGALTHGRLVFLAGAAGVMIQSDAAPEELYRARCEPPLPTIEVETNLGTKLGTVNVRYSRWPRFRWRGKSTAQIALNASIPWQIEIRGGAANVTADLSSLRLGGLDIIGGVSHISALLPDPAGMGTVPIRITGGISHTTVLRPAGTPIRAQIQSGASHLTLDDQYFGAIGGETRWQSPDYDRSTDRYDIEVRGGASKLTIATR